MHQRSNIRPITLADREGWRPLWDGYNAFYGRSGSTALPEEITAKTWNRLLDDAEPVSNNQAGRALYDKVAKYLGFIVYSHEL